MKELPEVLTVQDAAEHLGVSRQHVYRWIREGKLEASRPSPRTTRITQGQLQRFLEKYGV